MFSHFVYKLIHNVPFRAKTLLLVSFIFNVVYAIFLFVVGIISSSNLFLITALYYLLLSIARIFVFAKTPENNSLSTRIKTMQACGWYLLVINFAFSIMSFALISSDPLQKQGKIAVITLATYTFYSLTIAIINCVKYLKKDDYVHSSAKLLSLISASVSMVTLTNTMLSTFGDDNTTLKSYILPILCAVVSIFIIVCAILMIKKATLTLRRLNNEQERR